MFFGISLSILVSVQSVCGNRSCPKKPQIGSGREAGGGNRRVYHDMTYSGMICLDLDGTLLNREGKISSRNRESIQACLEWGIHVCFVTGRPYCFARSLADTIDKRIGVIACSGACYEYGGRLVTEELPDEAVRQFADCLERSGAHAFFKGLTRFYTHDIYDERFLYDHHNSWFSKGLQVQSFPGLSWQELKARVCHIHKILVYDADRKALAELAKHTEKIAHVQVSWYRDISFDVTAEGTDKGIAVEKVRLCLGLEKEQVLAIGDAWNDMPMFRSAGWRIAMGNAVKEVRDICDEITGSNEEDGVAEILEQAGRYFRAAGTGRFA